MDTIGYLVFGYMIFGILLSILVFYLDQKLKRHVDIKYPEEGKVIRSYEWQWYTWSIGRRTLRALIKKQSFSDPELAHRAKRAKWSTMYFLAWFVLGLIMFFIRILFFLVK